MAAILTEGMRKHMNVIALGMMMGNFCPEKTRTESLTSEPLPTMDRIHGFMEKMPPLRKELTRE